MRTRVVTSAKLEVLSGSAASTVQRLASCLQRGESAHVVTLNPEIFVHAQEDADYLALIREATIRTCDGVGLQVAAALRDRERIRRITGVDLLNAAIAQKEHPVLFIGATTQSREAAEVIAARRGARVIEGESVLCKSQVELEGWARRVGERLSEPAFAFVALGAPKQDWFIRSLLASCSLPIAAVGCGGAIDYLSGQASLAPTGIRRLGLEWAFRLMMEPSRGKRMFRALPRFLISEVLLRR